MLKIGFAFRSNIAPDRPSISGANSSGTIFAAYLVLYGIGRLWIEHLRIDPAHVIAGVRLNDWVFGIVVILAVIYLIVSLRRRTPAPA